MKYTKFALGALIMLVLAMTAFAQTTTAPLQKTGQVVVQVSDQQPMLLNISVLAIGPTTTAAGAQESDVVAQFAQQCAGNWTCIAAKSSQSNALSKSYQFSTSSLAGANISVFYFTTGQWVLVPGCENLATNTATTTSLPSPAGPVSFTLYSAQCDVTKISLGKAETNIRVAFQGTANVTGSTYDYQVQNGNVTASSAFAAQINDFIQTMAKSGTGGTLPCVGMFLIMGLLLASLYFSGKSPVSLLDITTPKLPTPKGVTAGGQILAPFGYTEMKKTVGDKMDKAAKALTVSTSILQGNMRGDAELGRLTSTINAEKDAAAQAAGKATVLQEKAVATSIVTAGRCVGMTEAELRPLARSRTTTATLSTRRSRRYSKRSKPRAAARRSWR